MHCSPKSWLHQNSDRKAKEGFDTLIIDLGSTQKPQKKKKEKQLREGLITLHIPEDIYDHILRGDGGKAVIGTKCEAQGQLLSCVIERES